MGRTCVEDSGRITWPGRVRQILLGAAAVLAGSRQVLLQDGRAAPWPGRVLAAPSRL
jgi:hypothetical protein